jgi:hypothetical protein
LKEKAMKKYATVAVIVLVLLVFVLYIGKVDVAAKWKTEARDNTGNLGFNISGETYLIDAKGQRVALTMIAKLGVVPLSFFKGQTEVAGMVTTLTWTASGQDVDWSTLKLTVSTSGTGGFSKTSQFTAQSGSVSITLPISTQQLGRTPSSGESVTWTLTITVNGQVNDKAGRTLTAQANPITSTVTTVWYEPSFSISSTASTSTDGSTSSGGCGLFGQHAIWVYNVQAVPTILDYAIPLVQTALAIIVVTLVLCTVKIVKGGREK